MRREVLAGIGLALAVAALVVGASFIGVDAGGNLERAEAQLRRLYERGEAQAVTDRLAEGSFGTGPQEAEQVRSALEPLLAEGLEVVGSDSVTVRGVELARISTPRLQWCVLPNNELLLTCRVASAQVQAQVEQLPIQVTFSSLDVYADQAVLTVVLTTSGGDPVSIGEPSMPAPYQLADVAYVAGGQRAPAPPGAVEVQPGVGLLLVFTASDIEAALDGPLTVSLEGGEIVLELTDVSWAVGGEAA